MHPKIAEAVGDLMANGHPWEAVFAACKSLVLLVKERSGRHDLDGVPLMRQVFSRHKPVLRFNALQSVTDSDEQEGMMHLYEGVIMALRNPGGHSFPTGPSSRASQYLQLISMLAERADEASLTAARGSDTHAPKVAATPAENPQPLAGSMVLDDGRAGCG
ncbi:TIGR02391 family protein [Pelomonas sp. HMWF004]|nr:TIGR02391 family protein [Pelomonas sp. HMWF004]